MPTIKKAKKTPAPKKMTLNQKYDIVMKKANQSTTAELAKWFKGNSVYAEVIIDVENRAGKLSDFCDIVLDAKNKKVIIRGALNGEMLFEDFSTLVNMNNEYHRISLDHEIKLFAEDGGMTWEGVVLNEVIITIKMRQLFCFIDAD